MCVFPNREERRNKYELTFLNINEELVVDVIADI